SEFMQMFWWLLFLLGVGAIIGWNRWRKSESGKPVWDRWMLKMPIFGSLIRLAAVARFTRTLSTLLHAGVPILSALSITRSIVGNHVLSEVIEEARESVKEGHPIAEPL